MHELGRLTDRDREGELAAAAQLALDPDFAEVQVDQLARDVEPEAKALGAGLDIALNLPKPLENRLHVLRRDARTVVRHPDHDLVPVRIRPCPQLDLAAFRRELQRVDDQVDDHPPDLLRVAIDARQTVHRLNVQRDLADRGLALQRGPDALENVPHGALLAGNPQNAGLQFADVQHVVDHDRQVVHPVADDVEVFTLVGRHLTGQSVAHDRSKLLDHRERRAELVRDVVDKLVRRLVQLGQALVLLFEQIPNRVELGVGGLDFRQQTPVFVIRRLHPRRGPHPGGHDDRVERFGDVVLGPRVQALDDVLVLILGRNHNDRDRLQLRIGLQSPTRLDPVHLRHHDVQQDDVGQFPRGGFQGLPPVARGQHLVPLIRQFIAQQLHVVREIVYDEHLNHGPPPPDRCGTGFQPVDRGTREWSAAGAPHQSVW